MSLSQKTNLLLFLFSITLLSSCQQKFAFRKTYKLKAEEQVLAKSPAIKRTVHNEPFCIDTTSQILEQSLITMTAECSEIASVEINTPVLGLEKEWKQTRSKENSLVAPPSNSERFLTSGSVLAVAGFIFAVAGLLSGTIVWVFLFAIAAIICSLIGITSRLNWLAYAGLIIGIIDLLLLVVFIAFGR
jgi:hypothetical protein